MAASKPPPSKRSPAELRGQAKVIYEIKQRVDAWRGFELGTASEPYPNLPPRYEPGAPGESGLTETSRTLLLHWFRREPHQLGVAPGTFAFKYWPHQRRLVESFIYLYEVCGIRRTEELYALSGVEPLGPQRDPWAKLGGELATGSGKTKMMSLLIAWSYLNAVREPSSSLGFGRHAILIAPNLFVKDRLLQDFAPANQRPSIFWSDPVVPPELETSWNLKVYSPDTCPRSLDPEDGALVVTNIHQLLRTRDDEADAADTRTHEHRQLDLLFHAKEPQKLEAVDAPLIERFARSRGLLVLNDEAHHVWDETGHAKQEQKAKEAAKLSGEEADAMAWIRSIRRLNGEGAGGQRVALQADLSATLFEEQGASKQKSGRTEFKQVDRFRHTAVSYSLADAIRDGIVKKPILERVEAKNKKTGEPLPLVNTGAPNGWERYSVLLSTGIERWKKVRDQLVEEGDKRKPILFVLCDNQTEAKEIANYLSHGQAVTDDLSGLVPTGYLDPLSGQHLFLENGESTVVQIHIGKKEEANELEWEKVRQAVNAIDADAIPDPAGARDDDGQLVMIPNPYNVVVSVMMLKEGWDVRNVKVIVPLRPCESRTLAEQTLGRGLRKMHAPVLDDDGAAMLQSEDLFVIEHPSFRALIDQIQDIVELKASDEIDHAREYVPIEPNPDETTREQVDVRLVRFDGLAQTQRDWRKSFDLAGVPALAPKIGWLEEIPETEIQTYLMKALDHREEDGQTFSVPANPTYRDFDHVIEVAFAIPLLRELRTSFAHKNAVKDIARQFLERKTFALPAGIFPSFSAATDPEVAKIALGNLARPDVIERVRKALLAPLHEAFTAERASTEALMSERRASKLAGYQAIKKHVLQSLKRSSFTTVAVDSADERRVAELLDRAPDVVGWIYNHRTGVGYAIEYDWQGYTSHYYPDFIARAKLGEVFHNFIIEVKGRLDERDRAKARRGRRYCELLTTHDKEPWHYLLLIENPSESRSDIEWWEQRSSAELGHVLKRHESLPLVPTGGSQPPKAPALEVLESVSPAEQFQSCAPVYDLAVAAGAFGESQTPEPAGWMRVQPSRALDRRMFVARVVGHSMEDGISDGSWALFRLLTGDSALSATALDGKRVVVQLRDADDPETGGRYTLKRWRVTAMSAEGGVEQIELRPDNPAYKTARFTTADTEIRAVAEFLEIVG